MAYDLMSSSNLRCLTFVLHQILPLTRLVEEDKERQDVVSKTFSPTWRALLEQHAFASGSTPEGLSVPAVICTDNINIKQVIDADLDLMFISSWFDIVSNDQCLMSPTGKNICRVVLEPEKQFPGYVRLAIPEPTHFLPQDVVMVNERYFLNSEQMKIDFLNVALQWDTEYGHFDPRAGIAGPAINCTVKPEGERLKECWEREYDLVRCYSLKEWPAFAGEWYSRERFFEWPNRQMVDEIGGAGCHIVCIGHPRSDHPETQFRMSFSLPEKILARNLNMTQRQAYILLKILQVQCFKQPKVLSTYCLKNLLFWACEETKLSFWKPDNLGACLLHLLDRLLFFLSRRNVPHYFLRENNLIHHVPMDHIREAQKKVSMARKDPLKYILAFNEMLKFTWGPFYTHIGTCVAPILQHKQYTTVPKDVLYEAEIKSLNLLAVAYLEETIKVEMACTPDEENTDSFVKRYIIVMEIIQQIVYIKKEVFGSEIPLEQHLLDFLDDINSVVIKVHFLLYLSDIFSNSEYLPAIYSKRASVCYSYVVANKSTVQEENRETLRKILYNAIMAYTQAIKHPKCPNYILVEFGSFENQGKDYVNAKIMLLEALRRLSINEGKQHYHVYNKNHEDTVDEVINYVIKRRHQFVVTSPVLAHFLLVRCHLVLGEDNNASRRMYHFKKLCAATAEDAVIPEHVKGDAFFLIAYCNYQMKRYEVCLGNVDRALRWTPDHVGAICLRTWCLIDKLRAAFAGNSV